jgi:uncharacterized protein YjiS (DUF1127 family)
MQKCAGKSEAMQIKHRCNAACSGAKRRFLSYDAGSSGAIDIMEKDMKDNKQKTALLNSMLSFTDMLRREFARMRIERQLSSLSDRMLVDIGLNRDQILGAARQAVGMDTNTPPLGNKFRALMADLFRPLVGWVRRRRLYSELAALDDRLLADIGLSRYELQEIVKNMDSVAARTLGTYPQAMRGYDMMSLAVWGRARIRTDHSAAISPANSSGKWEKDRHAA